MDEKRDVAVAFGPVGLAGWGLLVLGILVRSRLVAGIGLAGVVADVTVAELGGFKAMNEARLPADDPSSG
ncbi:MAG: hypothetical protein R6W48_09820 [Gaiellaceae bacterium]